MAIFLNNFPNYTRGTFRIKGDEDNTESEKLAFAIELVKKIAWEKKVDILLDSKMQGHGWILLWWPANEPRHLESDNLIRKELYYAKQEA